MTVEIIEQPTPTLEITAAQVAVGITETAPAGLTITEDVTTVEIVQPDQVTVTISSGPKGDQGESGNPAVSAEADEQIQIGQPIWVKSTTHIGLAKGDAQATARVGGLATTAANATFSADYVTDGVLVLDDWTEVVGATLLTPGATYFLSAGTAGMLTTTASTASGFVVAVGRALNATTLDIEISQPVRL